MDTLSYRISFAFAMLFHVVVIALLLIKFAAPQYSTNIASSNIINAVAVNINDIPHQTIVKHKKVFKKPVVKTKKLVVKPKLKDKVLLKNPLTKKLEQQNLAKAIQEELKQNQTATQTAKANQKPAFSGSQIAVIDKFKAQIISAISANWLVPQNVSQDLKAVLLLNIAPGGVVLGVKVVQSSGSDVLDRSAINAVYKSSPLPVPEDPVLFNEFRSIKLTVKPNLN